VFSHGFSLFLLTDINVCEKGRHHPLLHFVTPVFHRDQFWAQSFSHAKHPQSVSLQTHLASAYNSMLMIHNHSDRHACTTVTTSQLPDCLSALHSWFCHNGLALNNSKFESILIGTRQRLRIFPSVASPTIAGTPIQFSQNHQNAWRHTGPKLDLT